ncbi:GAF domain-containing protein [Roseibium denhamense]|uniref:Transcriptional regulator containing GAF, AAA-type ATPase, and DNA-binding Fis domains n=1 Tax=Roseibium denhamense TaxID=76305 RepID=A0ABY1NX25_9HYPH|nr:sigma 54-interacting transcriptional regulator [Roseibium denhamense]MTI04408.1 GAF domain-containing protein [Roseibium denhamense]SMP19916.1 Transcriptional regulator containing GAF, AAA-type ATPase, and DNA-binding Fis domains [Roseibium denhamense]
MLDEILELTEALAGAEKVETVLDLVLDSALKISRAEGGSIYTLDTLGRNLHRTASKYFSTASAVPSGERIDIYGPDGVPNLNLPSALVVSTGTVINISDIKTAVGYDFSRIEEDDRVGGTTTRSLVIVPMTVLKDRSVGILQLINTRNGVDQIGAVNEKALKQLQALTIHAGICLWNARILEENTRMKKQFDRYVNELPKQMTKRPDKPLKPAHKKPQGLVGDSPPIEKAINLIGKAAGSDVPILLRGETGTGKEMMAAFIHQSSDRTDKPFVVQNCAALPEALLESELFGHVKGAFTGAGTNKQGLAHEAHNGTLFLDEIGDMPLALQAKVLRLLQEGEVRRVGATKTEYVDVRIVGATNVNLEEKIEQGEFRRDLFYRLNVFPINLPPLRERPSDIPKLIDHFLKQGAAKAGRPVPVVDSEALDALMCWSYPGNVRELKNILDRARLMAEEGYPIQLEHLPIELSGPRDGIGGRMPSSIPDGDLKSIVGQYEALVIEAKMREAGWNKTNAARLLKVSRRTIIEKLNRYNITRPAGF